MARRTGDRPDDYAPESGQARLVQRERTVPAGDGLHRYGLRVWGSIHRPMDRPRGARQAPLAQADPSGRVLSPDRPLDEKWHTAQSLAVRRRAPRTPVACADRKTQSARAK